MKVGDDELPDQQEARRAVQQGSVLGLMFFCFVFVFVFVFVFLLCFALFCFVLFVFF